ncbi:MAG: hypothetical protein KYX68_01470 [Flavobacterium sp.]|nr:hypothetical protein [Flavobacterium sp.]
MKSIYNSYDTRELIERIDLLEENSKTLDGNLTAEMLYRQMLIELDIAFGKQDIKVSGFKKSLSVFFKNYFIKNALTQESHDYYYRKSPKELNTLELKLELIQKINRIGNQGKHAIMKMHHPFWGKMTYHDWDKFVWDYMDNHLKRFGV